MNTTEYLYGDINPEIIRTQKETARAKIEAGKKLLSSLLGINMYDRDDERINKVLKAIEFNEKLLEE